MPSNPPRNNASPSSLTFPAGFLWGVGSSAYQTEGNLTNTQWYEFEQNGGVITGDRSGSACDWWNHAENDFDLAQKIGVTSMRITVDWSRIEPVEGTFDAQAMQRYRAMVLALIERGIRPMVALHHFANPLWFERKGAFLDDQSSERFARFARYVAEHLKDLCHDWITFNEPNVYANLGYMTGEHPPAIKGSLLKVTKVIGNLALSHAAAYDVLHEVVPEARVSYAQHFAKMVPANPRSPLDRLMTSLADRFFNRAFIDIVAWGKVALLHRLVNRNLAHVQGKWDFVSINTYGKFEVAFDLTKGNEGFQRRQTPRDAKHIGDLDPFGNNLYGDLNPQAIEEIAETYRSCGKPFFVLESGCQDKEDRVRPWVIARGLKGVHSLLSRGFDVIGYHHWTLVDNFEWSFGWALRFGLIDLNLETKERTLRPSARFYADIIARNALTRSAVTEYAPDAVDEIFAP